MRRKFVRQAKLKAEKYINSFDHKKNARILKN